jgi:hypothetical protein
MKPDNYATEAVLRVGEVIEVSGRWIFVRVERNKNLSDLFFDGQLLRNVSVNGYIEIRKGFLSLIGKVEGEKTDEDVRGSEFSAFDKNRRVLTVALVGFINKDGHFFWGDARAAAQRMGEAIFVEDFAPLTNSVWIIPGANNNCVPVQSSQPRN